MSFNIAKSVVGSRSLKPPAPNTTANTLRDIEEGRITLYTPMILQPNKFISVRIRDPYQIRIGNSSPITIASTGLAKYTAPPDAKLYIEPLTYPGFGRHWESLPNELKIHVLEYNLSFDEVQLRSDTLWHVVPLSGEKRLREDSQWPEVLSHHLALPGKIGLISKEVFGARNTFVVAPRLNKFFNWLPHYSITQYMRSLRLTLHVSQEHWILLSRIPHSVFSALDRLHLHVTFDWSKNRHSTQLRLELFLMNPPVTDDDILYFPTKFKLKVDFTGHNDRSSRRLEELIMTKFHFMDCSGKHWVKGKRIFS